MRFSQSTHLLFLSLETLSSTIRTDLPILVELMDLVNSVTIFPSQMTLLRWSTFLLESQAVILIVLLFWIYIFLLTLVFVLQWHCSIGKVWSCCCRVSIDFPSNSQQDLPFHCIAHDYSCADWDGLCDHLRDVPWENIFKPVVLLLVNFVSGFMLELMYISLIENIRPSLTHLYGYQLLVLLP